MSNISRTAQSLVAPLLERDGETGALRAAVERTAGGAGSLVIVEGPAGIGKTRLLHEVSSFADRAGLLVRSARGSEMERDLPFGIARQLFEALIAHASDEDKRALLSGSAQHALGSLGLAQGEAAPLDSFAHINGLYWLVSNLSDRQPALLVVDDAHWSDGASLRFLTFLARRLADLPCLVALGVRTGEPDEPQEIAHLRLEGERLQPKPLSPGSVHELITASVEREPTERFSAACAEVTAGNPFFVSEVIRELRSEGFGFDDTAAASISKLAPENVVTSVLLRLSRFGDEAIAIARAIAVLGRAPQIRYVADLAGVDEEEALRLCDELRRAEILSAETTLEFVHPLVRQAIYHELDQGERSVAHRRAAELLDRSGAEALDVAMHLLECAPNGDRWVAARLQEAARVAVRRGAFESAVAFLERALVEPAQDQLRVLSRLGPALIDTDPFRAADVLTDVVERTADDELKAFALKFLTVAGQYTIRLGDVVRACEGLLDLIGDEDSDLVLVFEAQRHLFRRWRDSFDQEDIERFDALVETMSADTMGERLIRQASAWDRYCRCEPIAEIVDLALPFPRWPWIVGGFPSTVPALALLALAWSGRWKDVREVAERWSRTAREGEWSSAVSMGHAVLATVDRLSGRLYEAEPTGRTAWEIARTIAPTSSFGWFAFANLAATLLIRGELTAFDELTAGVDLSMGAESLPGNWPLEIKAQGHLVRGEIEEGVESFLALGEGLERIAWFNPAYPQWRQEATEGLAALGRTSEATQLVAIAEERARTFGAPHVIGTVLRARATVEPSKRSIDTLLDSVRAFEVYGPPHELARSLIELGTALHRSGRRSEAREPLRRALEEAHRCGAGLLEQRAKDELAATGARPRRLAVTGVAALTATERSVAELAANGLTNNEIAERMFVAARTIETHLTHIYDKLAIGGRRELAGALTSLSSKQR
ncbi:MAG TPA: AAA family ATPase [Actinomycetota bacterium]|nr:AAA family ATPase [Actinomycetota bacterium]